MGIALLMLLFASTVSAVPVTPTSLYERHNYAIKDSMPEADGSAVNPTKTLALAVTAEDTLEKRHNYAMNCGALSTYCNQQGYYCNGAGKLGYTSTENQTCNHACKCVNLAPKPPIFSVKPCPAPILGFSSPCKEVTETDADSLRTSDARQSASR